MLKRILYTDMLFSIKTHLSFDVFPHSWARQNGDKVSFVDVSFCGRVEWRRAAVQRGEVSLRATERVTDQKRECSTCWIIPFPPLSASHSRRVEMDQL